MNPQKTHTQEKNKHLLYQLESLIKTLYPKHNTTNPYESYLEDYYNELNIEDLLLFKRLLKSITILNHKERPQDTQKYISSYGDVLTAIELMSQYTINDKLLKSYTELKYIFQDRPFTQLQACRVLRVSQTTVRRLLKLLKHLKLAETTNIRQGKKYTYRLLSYQKVEDYNDYSDYQGYINLEERT